MLSIDYSSFFSVVNTGRILELSLHTDLPTEVLENKVAIVLALFAEEPEENLTASATLILDVAQEKYVGKCNAQQSPVISFKCFCLHFFLVHHKTGISYAILLLLLLTYTL